MKSDTEHETAIERANVHASFAEAARRIEVLRSEVGKVRETSTSALKDLADTVARFSAELHETRAELARMRKLLDGELDLISQDVAETNAQTAKLATAILTSTVTKRKSKTRMIPTRDPKTQRIIAVDTVEVEE
jgi:hypothetical protein